MGTMIQIHTLTGYSSVLLNRDDAGLAKRIEYGSAIRTRTSSQFAKRKLRLAEGAHSISSLGEMSVRSRLTFRRLVAEPLVEEGFDVHVVAAATLVVMDELLGVSAKAKGKRSKKEKAEEEGAVPDPLAILERNELIVLGASEIAYILGLVREIVRDAGDAEEARKKAVAALKDRQAKANLLEIGQANKSLDVAMYGRMVTGDTLSAMDAAVHVAHAISVHGQRPEVDYFTAVDDLKAEGEDHGAAHVGEVELTSPLLYGYYVVDFDQLLANLKGLDNAREVAARLVANLINLTASGIVGAKKGSTAPYSTADFLMVEVGYGANRTLAEAFRKPVAPTVEAAVEAISSYVAGKDAMYGDSGNRKFVASIVDVDIPGAEKANVPGIASAVESMLAG